jgi:hypothetical protein
MKIAGIKAAAAGDEQQNCLLLRNRRSDSATPATQRQDQQDCDSGDACTSLGEEFAMASVKGKAAIRWNVYFADQHSRAERPTVFVLQDLRDPSQFVYETGHPGVGSADHWPSNFHTAKDRVGKMLA